MKSINRAYHLLIPIAFAICMLPVLTACGGQDPAAHEEPNALTDPQAGLTGDPLEVGVLTRRSAVAASAEWGPLLDYLALELDRPVELVPLLFEEQFAAVQQGTVDFIISNPLAGTEMQRLYGLDFLATVSRKDTGTEFAGLIIVSADSDIYEIDDLYDRSAACVNFETGAGGCIFQMYHLLENDFDAFEDFSSFTEIESQDNIVLSVLNGSVDVGFIRTGQLEKMVDEGLITSMDEIRIIDQAESDFIYPHTTRLYPEWVFAALADTDAQISSTVKNALVSLDAGHPAMQAIGAVSFVPDVDYQGMHDLIETLQLRGWDTES